ncbi:hypothetical protein NIES2101_43755 [Calothrix sp. HK-06]|nr:hypothetical protein NIES2101_43755 [Calothrix sp. HK-06]
MKAVVCTLYESHYHYGVAALINSLYSNGFKGDIYVGYRGDLPFWALEANKSTMDWEDSKTLRLANDLSIHFLPVSSNVHFTNYKPEFILQLWNNHLNQSVISGIFYFDPDIINKCDWSFYENWISYGVSLVNEIVWNDMPPTHPKRQQWLKVANSLNYSVTNNLNSYLNAGFIGVSKNHIGFVRMWNELIEHSVKEFNFDKTKFFQSKNNYSLFSVGDQDLLNLTAMCTKEPISLFGPEGMDFLGGGWLMSHSTGSPKPWKTNFLKELIFGKKPTIQSKLYWQYSCGIIKAHSPLHIRKKLFAMKAASFLSRFYNR